jgi:Fic family protein
MAENISLEDRAKKFIRATNSCLEGSPYTFPEDDASIMRFAAIEESVNHIAEKIGKLASMQNLPPDLQKSLRAREVYESNAIEGLGPDLATTSHVIEATSVVHKSNKSYVEWAVTQGIKNDAHLYDVIGLTAARALSRDIAENIDRPISESDVRAIHEIILKDKPHSGIYKVLTNWIDGHESHQTSLPGPDTHEVMHNFVDWMNNLSRRGYRTSQSIVKAAAVHAWLTHIHPFNDGNGRLARLLANMILAREDMPPIILKNDAHRARYIDALAESDKAGDISRLIMVFCRAIERVIDDMEDLELAQEMFKEDINLRLSDEFKLWQMNLDKLHLEMSAALLLHGLKLEKLGSLSPSEYKRLRKGLKPQNSWYAKVKNRINEDVGLLYFGYIDGWLQTKLEKDEHYPVLILAKNSGGARDVRPFKDMFKGDKNPVQGVTRILLQPLEKKCYMWGPYFNLKKTTYDDAAKKLALTCSEITLS